jgi:hypothetical protein
MVPYREIWHSFIAFRKRPELSALDQQIAAPEGVAPTVEFLGLTARLKNFFRHAPAGGRSPHALFGDESGADGISGRYCAARSRDGRRAGMAASLSQSMM